MAINPHMHDFPFYYATATTEIVCPDGQHLGRFDNCTVCPVGNYSVSGGEVIQWYHLLSCPLDALSYNPIFGANADGAHQVDL
jgi:hypothetical protein